MPRADLHYAVVMDREIFEASRVDASVLDPIVRIEGGLPGVARPVFVVRDYQGPQGTYTEYFSLRDPQGREIASSRVRAIELSGEAFENRVVDSLRGVWFETGDEHSVTFFIDEEEVGTVPVFVESGLGGDPWVAARETFSKALAKGAVLWLTVPQPPGRGRRRNTPETHTQPVWFVFEDGKVYVFSGPTEQEVPALAEAREVELTARSKDVRSRVSRVPATVRLIDPGDPLFEKIARAGLGRRLNLPDGDGALDRWKANCILAELTPLFGRSAEAGAA
jgi:hypothetical protein